MVVLVERGQSEGVYVVDRDVVSISMMLGKRPEEGGRWPNAEQGRCERVRKRINRPKHSETTTTMTMFRVSGIYSGHCELRALPFDLITCCYIQSR